MTRLGGSKEPVGSDLTSLSRRIGFLAAASSTLFGLLYLLGLGVNLVTSGSFYPSGSDVRTVSAMIAILWNVALVALFVALRREAEPSKAILAELALVFTVLVCATSCTSWFVALTAYPRLAQAADPGLAALIDPYNPSSLSYALEHLGWGLFLGLATVLGGFALGSRNASLWLRWSLIATGILSLAHFLGVITASDALTLLGFVSWGVALPVASLLLAALFRSKRQQA
jgi:hypothetical protein